MLRKNDFCLILVKVDILIRTLVTLVDLTHNVTIVRKEDIYYSSFVSLIDTALKYSNNLTIFRRECFWLTKVSLKPNFKQIKQFLNN